LSIHPLDVLVMELPYAHDAQRINDIRNHIIRTIKSENFVRMLIEEIKPLAKRSIYLTLRPFADSPKTDCRPLTIGFVDIRDETTVLLTELWSFPFASHDGLPYVTSNLRSVFTNNRRSLQEPPQNRRRMEGLLRD
jgi:hypothetical protein